MTFKKLFFVIIGFAGWLLSPFTWWNDTFVNLPAAYVLAGIANKLLPRHFLAAFLISYWLTNVLGIALMSIGAGGLASKGLVRNKLGLVLVTIVIYSIISAFLIGFKIIRPF